MAEEVRLPKLGASMEEGTIVAWLAREGEHVKKGAPLYQVETDKAVMEVESPAEGRLIKILQQQGAKVAVNQAVALLDI